MRKLILFKLISYDPFLIPLAVFAVAIVLISYFTKPSLGYVSCWRCHSKLSWFRKRFFGAPFCSANCKRHYYTSMEHAGMIRLMDFKPDIDAEHKAVAK